MPLMPVIFLLQDTTLNLILNVNENINKSKVSEDYWGCYEDNVVGYRRGKKLLKVNIDEGTVALQ